LRHVSERRKQEVKPNTPRYRPTSTKCRSSCSKRDLPGSEEGDAVFTLAQARTTTAIRQLDGEQNQIVTHFLFDSGLLDKPALLAEAGLQNAELPKAMLLGANLVGTNLNSANLADAELINAEFSAVTKLGGDTIEIAADLTKVDLSKADLQGASLSRCTLNEATLTDAALQSADLRGASLQEADLSYADLTDADLTDADLTVATLTNATLTNARVTDEQLQKAKSLEGVTMPNGQKYEDWLKDQEGGGKERENNGPW
jgi:uncharacterized protein YjbI with pentapeptide repeats